MRRHIIALLVALGFIVPSSGFAQEQLPPPDDSWWRPLYLVDYGLIVAGATTYILAGKLSPRDEAIFGPEFDPANPEMLFEDPENTDRIGRLYVEEGKQETVPVPHLIGIAGAMGGALALQEIALWLWSDRGSARHFHEVFVGYAETQALVGGLTEASKVFVGRLRPDFQDRAARHLCNTNPPDGFDCGPYEGRPLDPDPEEAEHIFEDGRKSSGPGTARSA